jgi:uncharacterized protein
MYGKPCRATDYPRLPVLGPAPMFEAQMRRLEWLYVAPRTSARNSQSLIPGAGIKHFAVKAGGRFLTDHGMTNSEGISIGIAGLQRELAAGRAIPPVERWNPQHCGDIDIRIARDGTWYHQGTPFGRRELVRLFSTILRKDPDGYHLVTPAEKMRIRVDDAPFVAVLLDVQGEGHDQRLMFTTNVGDDTIAGRDNPIRVEIDRESGEPSPYVHVRKGLEALIARSVFYQLAELAVPGPDGMMGVWSDGMYFVLGSAA